MIRTMICEVVSSSYGPEGCRGLVTEGSGADGPDVAGCGHGRSQSICREMDRWPTSH
jgi:hypothetical protein